MVCYQHRRHTLEQHGSYYHRHHVLRNPNPKRLRIRYTLGGYGHHQRPRGPRGQCFPELLQQRFGGELDRHGNNDSVVRREHRRYGTEHEYLAYEWHRLLCESNGKWL